MIITGSRLCTHQYVVHSIDSFVRSINMIKTCLVLSVIGLTIAVVFCVPYNQRCTFSSGTCSWHIGRRWRVENLDDEIGDQVLVAVDRSNQDKEMGFTDVITSSRLSLTTSCSFDIRLTFQFSIENEQDQIEVFLIKKEEPQVSSIGQWKALTRRNVFEDIESLWQQANITFAAAEEFQIEIEIRHLPDNKFDSTTWFAIDDILIESCSNAQATDTIEPTATITPSPSDFDDSSSLRNSFFRHRWRLNDTYEESISPRLTFFTFMLYTICTLVAITLLCFLLVLIIFMYRKHCLPPSTSSSSTTDHRHHSNGRKKYQHKEIHNNHIDQDARTERTMVTTIRP